MTGLSDRTGGLAGRVGVEEHTRDVTVRPGVEERPRDLKSVALVMLDGTQIRGMLHRAPGTRTLDYLNRQAESFVAMTGATVIRGEHVEHVSFVAINKAHIIRVVETPDPD